MQKTFLKKDIDKLFLMSYGKAFHSSGAATEENLFKLYDGVKRRCLDNELNWYDGVKDVSTCVTMQVVECLVGCE